LSGRLTECRHCRYPATKGRCRGNQFWNYSSCKWHRTADDVMGFRIKNGLFSVNLYVCCSLSLVRSCGGRNCSRLATVQLGIDRLMPTFRTQPPHQCDLAHVSSTKANVLNLLSEYYPGINNYIFVAALPCTPQLTS